MQDTLGGPGTWTTADAAVIDAIRQYAPRPWPSAARIARESGYTVRTVRRTIAKMRRAGWGIEQRWRPNGSQTTNAYHLPQERAQRRVTRKRVTPGSTKSRSSGRATKFGTSKRRTTYRSSAKRRNFGRRQRWRDLMGDVVAFDSGLPDKPNASVGQALFAALVDELEVMGVGIIPRTLIATAAGHGRRALDDGVQPEIVLAGCLLAIQQGKPQYASHIIGDICLAQAGAMLTPIEYRHLLSIENRKKASSVSTVREALAAQKDRKELNP